jgi:hypothetical protein
MQNQLAIKGNYDIAAPGQMAAMAKVLQAHIGAHGLSTNIVGKQYTNVEGWQFAGGLMGYLPKVVKVENISVGNEKKWRADVELIRIKDDKVMGTGSAICSNVENKKRAFDEYAIMSMAQTRAIGKAYRNLIGWVMKLAGYEATPFEEMVKMGEQAETKYQPKQSVEQPAKPQTNVNYILKLKAELNKLGADSLTEAIKIYNKMTGENIKSLPTGQNRAKEMLFALLNSPNNQK